MSSNLSSVLARQRETCRKVCVFFKGGLKVHMRSQVPFRPHHQVMTPDHGAGEVLNYCIREVGEVAPFVLPVAPLHKGGRPWRHLSPKYA